jgi:putative component of membrane protein insertase Oxa1/YidC/SpoIIIJ protein YidD
MAILLIKFYQRFISPYKGFRCAHACSEAVKKIIQEHGVFSSRTRISQRFSVCRVANDQFCANASCCVDALSLKKRLL